MKMVNIALFFLIILIASKVDAAQSARQGNETQVKSLKHVRGNIDRLPSFSETERLVLRAAVVDIKPRTPRFKMAGIDGIALGKASKEIQTQLDHQDDGFALYADKTAEELKDIFNNKILVHYRKKLLDRMRTFKRHSLWLEFNVQIKKQRVLNKAKKRAAQRNAQVEGIVYSNPNLPQEYIKDSAQVSDCVGGSLSSGAVILIGEKAHNIKSETVDIVD